MGGGVRALGKRLFTFGLPCVNVAQAGFDPGGGGTAAGVRDRRVPPGVLRGGMKGVGEEPYADMFVWF
jgi:hypothetical protein